MSYTKTAENTYLATNGMEYYGWIGMHILDPDGFYSSKSNCLDEDEVTPEDPPPATRKCRKCGEIKPLYHFAKKPVMSIGSRHYRVCKICFAQMNEPRDRSWARKQMREYYKKRYTEDPIFRFTHLTRSRIKDGIKNKSASENLIDFLGCTGEEAFYYLVSRFASDMTIEAFMNGEIHIDHIKPVSAFDLTRDEEIKECFHYTNLQPLWAADNLRKGAKWDGLV